MMVNITCNKCDKCDKRDKRDKRDKHDKHDSVLYFWNPDDSSITSILVDTSPWSTSPPPSPRGGWAEFAFLTCEQFLDPE